jgi:EmrB/QacA subfamily drug resistance transporter
MEPDVAATALAVDAGGSPTWATAARRRLVFTTVSLALFMASVDQTIVATVLPALQHDLHTRLDWGAWTITAYTLGQLITMPIAGKGIERFGRKRLFLGAVALFTAASLACGFATNIYELVTLRAIQSIGGGAFMPAATGIVADLWYDERDKALGAFSSIFPIGGIVGPALGGLFTEYWTWRGVFLVNVPIGLALLAAGYAFIPSRKVERAQRFDLVGVGLLCVTLLSGMLGVTYLGAASHTPVSAWFIGPIALSVLAGWLFVRHSRRTAEPLIPMRLVTGPGFGVMNIINVIFGAAAAGFSALVPVYALDRLHISTLSASTMLIARSVAMVLASIVAVRLLRRSGTRLPMTIGYLVIAAGLLMMLPGDVLLTPYAWISAGAAVTGLGVGISGPSSNNAALQLAPQHAAAVAGIRGMIRQVGGITAVSISTTIAARTDDPARSLGWSFAVFAGIVVLVVPLIRKVPEHRGAW